MKRRAFFIVVLFGISLLLPLACAYTSYNIIVEADFLTNGVKFEAIDTENLLLDKQNFGVLSDALPFSFLLSNNFIEPWACFCLLLPASHPTPPILRC